MCIQPADAVNVIGGSGEFRERELAAASRKSGLGANS
jgi:hypothetical protein